MVSQSEYDLIVVGSGAAGLSAAVTAAHEGLNVLVLEKASTVGGATAWSGGWMWVPFNFLAIQAGIIENPAHVRTYLKHELGDKYQTDMIEQFLKQGPEMVRFFHEKTALAFDDGSAIPDIHGNVEGAATGGHQLIASPYDARALGKSLKLLRKPMRETSFIGMPIQAGTDLMAFLNVLKSVRAFIHVSKRITRQLFDLLFHRRATHLVNGQALVARLLKSALDLGVDIQVNSSLTNLHKENGAVIGVDVMSDGVSIAIKSRHGVVIATGGFAHDKERRQSLFPRSPKADEHWPLAPESCSGDGLRIAESVGAHIETDLACAVAWAPVSLPPFAKGKVGHFPHIIDRAKPGVIAVLKNGRRFVNEADGYYDFVDAMVKNVPESEELAAWLVCDQTVLKRFGLGYVRPWPIPHRRWVANGYLKTANSIGELAVVCGIDRDAFINTIETTNQHSKEGIDPIFGKGSTPYNQKMGDASQPENPCIAEVLTPPYFAIKIVPGSFGTFAGLKVTKNAQVLDANSMPIKGLYAAGSDMASIMGGYYPSGGINLGPAMTFGYIAARSVISNSQQDGAEHE